MKLKLTPATIARIQERRAAGETLQSIAAAFKCSIGTVSNALAKPAASAPARAPKPVSKRPAKAATELPTADDLRRSLADQVRALHADVDAAETPQQRATANRLLVSAQQLLTRVTPPDPNVAPPGMVLIDANDVKRLADEGERRLLQLIKGVFAHGMPKSEDSQNE